MKPPFRLVNDQISHETVRAIEELLEQARSGGLIGLAFCAMYRERRYICNTAGEAARNKTFALGMVSALWNKLGAQVVKGR